MKTKFIALVLSLLIAMPCVLHAEEIEIQPFSNAGVYVLHIETASGALVGQFVVQ